MDGQALVNIVVNIHFLQNVTILSLNYKQLLRIALLWTIS